MIIQNTGVIASADVAQFAWSGLRRYSNVRGVKSKIVARFGLSKGQERNAEKQSEQLSFCLQQAREFFAAAQTATLATRPLQLYYGCMSLALAELLWKGDGTSSLDMLRQKHAHHGLELKIGSIRQIDGVQITHELATKINNPSDPRGTFAAWMSVARNGPLLGKQTFHAKDGSTQIGNNIIYSPDDRPLPHLALAATSFIECLRAIPAFYFTLHNFGERSDLVRCTLTRTIREDMSGNFDILETTVIHPGSESKVEEVASDFLFKPFMFEKISIQEISTNFILRLNTRVGDDFDPPATGVLHIPEGVSVSATETYLRPARIKLSEFGSYYLALYTSGMFCRYYPDVWMKHLSTHSEFSLLVEQLCSEAILRLPILTLSELDQCAYFPIG